MGFILAQLVEGVLVAAAFVLPMFIIFPLTYSFAIELLTLVLSLAGLSWYLTKRIALVDPAPLLLERLRRACVVMSARARVWQRFKERI